MRIAIKKRIKCYTKVALKHVPDNTFSALWLQKILNEEDYVYKLETDCKLFSQMIKFLHVIILKMYYCIRTKSKNIQNIFLKNLRNFEMWYFKWIVFNITFVLRLLQLWVWKFWKYQKKCEQLAFSTCFIISFDSPYHHILTVSLLMNQHTSHFKTDQNQMHWHLLSLKTTFRVSRNILKESVIQIYILIFKLQGVLKAEKFIFFSTAQPWCFSIVSFLLNFDFVTCN